MKLYNKVSMQWLVWIEHEHVQAMRERVGWHQKQTRFRRAHQGVLAWVNGE